MASRSRLIVCGLLLVGVVWCDPLHAQSYRSPRQSPYPGGGYSAPYLGGAGRYGGGQRALNAGYVDGVQKGYDDARHRNRYDPRGHRWYRSGDRGFGRDAYMTRNQYENDYRRGFMRGYDVGFRDGQRNTRYDRRRPGGGWPW
jgi:hypothetical protein